MGERIAYDSEGTGEDVKGLNQVARQIRQYQKDFDNALAAIGPIQTSAATELDLVIYKTHEGCVDYTKAVLAGLNGVCESVYHQANNARNVHESVEEGASGAASNWTGGGHH